MINIIQTYDTHGDRWATIAEATVGTGSQKLGAED